MFIITIIILGILILIFKALISNLEIIKKCLLVSLNGSSILKFDEKNSFDVECEK